MFGNKYSKTLTVVLIIVIIAIVGLLIFFGIDVYRKFYIEQASGEAMGDFQNQISNIVSRPQGNEVNTNTYGPSVDLNTLYQNTTTGDGNNNDDGNAHVEYMGYEMIGMIEIPATDVEYPIISDSDASVNSLNVAIVKLYPATIGLNEVGNTVLVGHNYRNGTFFSNNKRLQLGDEIYITDTTGRRIKYEITRKYETSTGDSTYMNRDTNGKREISLSTCTDDTTRRLIIWAVEAEWKIKFEK